MNKVIVLHDRFNGKRRVVSYAPCDIEEACEQCDIAYYQPIAGSYYCEFKDRYIIGVEECGFKDVFEPEDLPKKE